MYKLVISDDEGKTTVVPLVRDEITIGRKEGNTIRLTERNVSRKHARLFKANGAFTIEDLSSYNGIKVNGRKISDPSSLAAGDQVTIGDYLLALQVEAAETATEPTTPMASPETADAQTAMIAAPAAESVPPARLIMLSPPAPGAEFALSKARVRFGRAEDLDAWVNHRSISREHAEVVQDGDGFRILDLGSANGLRVNGNDVRDAPLQAGDVIEMGQVRFRFVGRGETYTFDADRTIQMEAVPSSGSRAPVIAALGIIVVAVAIGGVIAMSGGSAEDEPLVTAIEENPPNAVGDPGSPQEEPPAPASAADREAFQEALRSCQTALEERRFGAAVTHGNAALALIPHDATAQSCKQRAEAGQAEGEAFERAKRLLARGEVDEAYFAFEELPSDSPFRSEPDFARAIQRFARDHVRQAQGALRRNPDEAERHANMVLSVEGAPDAERQAAEEVIRLVQRSGRPSAGPPTGPRRQPRTARVPRAQESGGQPSEETAGGGGPAAGPDPIVRCRQEMMRGGDYNRCIVQNLEGRARSAREIQTLIETYRAMGNMAAALRHMEAFVRRFPSHSQARQYRQILCAHNRCP